MAKRIIAILIVLAMVFSLAACGDGNKGNQSQNNTGGNDTPAKVDKYGGVYRVVTTSKCMGLLPIKSTVAGQFSDACYESLIWIDALDNHIEKVLCTDYSLSADETEVTCKLRQGVKFHDGSDFNADAVVWNYEVANQNKMLTKSHNPKAVKVDDYTVKIVFDKKYIDYENALTLKLGSKEWYEKVGEETNLYSPCGTGPFKFRSFVPDTSVSFERWEGYWGKDADGNQLPYLDGFEVLSINDDNAMMTALVNGDGDCMKMGTQSVIDQLKASGFTDKRILGSDAFILYCVCAYDGGDSTNPWHDVKVREAIFKYGLNYEKIMKLGEPDLGILDHNLGASNGLCYDESLNKAYTYDAEKCKAMLKEAGYENGFDTTIYATSIAVDIATALQSELKAYNINLKVESIGGADQRRKDGTTPGLFMLTNGSAWDNIAQVIGSTFAPDGNGFNKNMIFSEKYAQQRLDAQGAASYEERAKLGNECIKTLLLEDFTTAVLCHVPTPIFESMDVHDSHCGNFQFTPATIWRENKTQKLD